MQEQNRDRALTRLATPLIILATVIWGSSFVVMKSSVDVLPTFWLLAIRFTASAIVLALVLLRPRLERGRELAAPEREREVLP